MKKRHKNHLEFTQFIGLGFRVSSLLSCVVYHLLYKPSLFTPSVCLFLPLALSHLSSLSPPMLRALQHSLPLPLHALPSSPQHSRSAVRCSPVSYLSFLIIFPPASVRHPPPPLLPLRATKETRVGKTRNTKIRLNDRTWEGKKSFDK